MANINKIKTGATLYEADNSKVIVINTDQKSGTILGYYDSKIKVPQRWSKTKVKKLRTKLIN